MLKTILFAFFIFYLPLSLAAEETISESAPVSRNYQLDTGDKIRIQVYNEDDLYMETRVDDNGVISYPFLGSIKVLGRTIAQLENEITSRLRGDYLINPKVSVEIMEYRQFFVNGEVYAPGGYAFQPGITIRKAISLAGGFKERASKDKIFIIRDKDSDKNPAKANLDDTVYPGDIITVEESFF